MPTTGEGRFLFCDDLTFVLPLTAAFSFPLPLPSPRLPLLQSGMGIPVDCWGLDLAKRRLSASIKSQTWKWQTSEGGTTISHYLGQKRNTKPEETYDQGQEANEHQTRPVRRPLPLRLYAAAAAAWRCCERSWLDPPSWTRRARVCEGDLMIEIDWYDSGAVAV